MLGVRVGVEEDGVLERLDLAVHLVARDVRLEPREVVDGAFAMRRGDDDGRVLPDVLGDFSPGGFDGGDGVSERAVLERQLSISSKSGDVLERRTYHVEENGIRGE